MKRAIIGRRADVIDYCREHGINPRDRDVILVSHGHALRGHIGPIEDVWVGVGLPMRLFTAIEDDLRWINATAPRRQVT